MFANIDTHLSYMLGRRPMPRICLHSNTYDDYAITCVSRECTHIHAHSAQPAMPQYVLQSWAYITVGKPYISFVYDSKNRTKFSNMTRLFGTKLWLY